MRYKTFNATGVAPNGRLYAGDLNWIQDLKVDLSNFSQVVDLAGLRIGESNLQLLYYGTLEARLTGAFRVDGILRGLGGIVPGTFTTAERNSIVAGKAPYGLAILNTETNQWEWNRGTDDARAWANLGAQKATLTIGDGVATVFRLTHGFATQDVIAMVREAASPWREVMCEIRVEDINYVDFAFDLPPAAGAYRAVVMA